MAIKWTSWGAFNSHLLGYNKPISYKNTPLFLQLATNNQRWLKNHQNFWFCSCSNLPTTVVLEPITTLLDLNQNESARSSNNKRIFFYDRSSRNLWDCRDFHRIHTTVYVCFFQQIKIDQAWYFFLLKNYTYKNCLEVCQKITNHIKPFKMDPKSAIILKKFKRICLFVSKT